MTDFTVVKPAVAVTSIKRDPPLSGHFRVPKTISNANAPWLSVHLSKFATLENYVGQQSPSDVITVCFYK